MKVLAVEPGPCFSVADVYRGWVGALRGVGCDVVAFNYSDRLEWYSTAIHHPDFDGRYENPDYVAIMQASKGIEAACWEFNPDVLLLVSPFYVPPEVYRSCRSHHTTSVLLGTESPYDDDGQLRWAAWADVVLVNDPTNLDAFRAVNPRSYYMPAAYDPAVHHPRKPTPRLASDFAFIGTGFPSRSRFLEAVDFDGIDVALGGNWGMLDEDSPLRPMLAHPPDECVENDETADIYASTKMSANIYRREADCYAHEQGWSMGPREVELAAVGCPFLRDPRGEGDEVLHMLPTFDGPADFGDKLRWHLAHDDVRDKLARQALVAIQDRTFTANARRLLTIIESL